MKEIKLYNRDGADLKLVSEDDKLWKFQVDDKHKYILEYCRVGYQKGDKEIDFVNFFILFEFFIRISILNM